jgi:hypothetical protein
MRVRVCLLAIAAISGPACFKELPPVPGDSAETSSESTALTATTSEPPTSSSESSESSTGVGTTDEVESDTDIDPTEGTTTEVAPPEDMGLFACEPEVCDVWERPDCKTACGSLDEAGVCLFALLRDRGVGRGDVRDCEGEVCERTAVALRGGGTDEVRRQSAVELEGGGLGEYKDLKVCNLREPEFFAGCLAELTPACVDFTAWFTKCEGLATACPDD